MNQIKYYICHNNGHYTNKFADIVPKNESWAGGYLSHLLSLSIRPTPKLKMVWSLRKSYICIFFTQFNEFLMEILMNLDNGVNAMPSSFMKKLGLCICKTNVGAYKIDGGG